MLLLVLANLDAVGAPPLVHGDGLLGVPLHAPVGEAQVHSFLGTGHETFLPQAKGFSIPFLGSLAGNFSGGLGGGGDESLKVPDVGGSDRVLKAVANAAFFCLRGAGFGGCGCTLLSPALQFVKLLMVAFWVEHAVPSHPHLGQELLVCSVGLGVCPLCFPLLGLLADLPASAPGWLVGGGQIVWLGSLAGPSHDC